MKLPKRIPVGSTMYELRYAKKGELPEHVMGVCHFKKKMILLCKGQQRSDLIHTLVHELKHALQWESGLSQNLDHQTMEMDAQATASMITSLFNLTFKKAA